jgi:hypothetical protein
MPQQLCHTGVCGLYRQIHSHPDAPPPKANVQTSPLVVASDEKFLEKKRD